MSIQPEALSEKSHTGSRMVGCRRSPFRVRARLLLRRRVGCCLQYFVASASGMPLFGNLSTTHEVDSFPCKLFALQLLKIDGLAVAQSSGQIDAAVFEPLQGLLT